MVRKKKSRFGSNPKNSTILQNIVYIPQKNQRCRCYDRIRSIIDLIDFEPDLSVGKPVRSDIDTDTDTYTDLTDCYSLKHVKVYCFPCDLLLYYYYYVTRDDFKNYKILNNDIDVTKEIIDLFNLFKRDADFTFNINSIPDINTLLSELPLKEHYITEFSNKEKQFLKMLFNNLIGLIHLVIKGNQLDNNAFNNIFNGQDQVKLFFSKVLKLFLEKL